VDTSKLPEAPPSRIHSDFRPRLNLDISEKQFFGLQKIPWGIKRIIFGIIIDDLLKLFKEFGEGPVIALLTERALTLKDISCPGLKKE